MAMFTFGKLDFDLTLESIKSKKSVALKAQHGIIKANTSSKRLEVFSKNLKCITCCRVGNIFLVQSHKIRNIESCRFCVYHKHMEKSHLDNPHINMYHVEPNGSLMLMTKDHIVPSSKGGSDHIDNLQTMCSKCNSKKGNLPFEEFLALKDSASGLGIRLDISM
jgi:5-methylcytosine-specific restriction endonuclease McrA